MSPRPGERAGGRTAERGAGKAGAAVLGRGLPAGSPAAPLALHFARLPTSRRPGRPRSAPRACPRPAGAWAREGGSWWVGRWRRRRRREEEEAAGVGVEAAPRPAGRRHLRRRLPGCAARTRRHPGAAAAAAPAAAATIAGLAACAGRPLLGPGSWGSSLLLAFTPPPFYPPSKSKWGRAVEMGPGRAQVCAAASRAVESLELRRAGDSRLSGPWELLNWRFPCCLLPPAFPAATPLFSSFSLLFHSLSPGLLPPKHQHFIPHSTFLWESVCLS